MNAKAAAPAILPPMDEPYVAIEDSVVLYLDLNRKDYHGEKTGHLNPKLAKLMGLANSVSPDDEEEESEMTSMDGDEDDLSVNESKEEEEDEDDEDDYNEQERMLLAGDMATNQKTPSVAEEKKNAEEKIYKLKQPKARESKNQRALSRQDSNIGQIQRYRSKAQLNRAGRKDLTVKLKDDVLPSSVASRHNIEEEWSIKECFEVMKFIISKHEGLFDHVKNFHIQHLQNEVLKQYTVPLDDEDEDESDGDGDGDGNDAMQSGLNTLSRPKRIRPAQSVDTGTVKKQQSVFARPSSLLLKKKMSMPALDVNGRKKTLEKRSSRYLLTQDKHRVMAPQKIKKQRSNTPAIIQPSNYQKGKAAKRSSKSARTDRTDIAGWEDKTGSNGMKIVSLHNNDAAPLKDKQKVEEMPMISDESGDENV